jgi:hypothetical protein
MLCPALRLLPLGLMVSVGLAHAGYDPDAEEATPWVELAANLPAAPKPESLVAIDLGPATSRRIQVDRDSVSVGADGVVRYSVLIQSEGGARTLNYEGMRCESGEWKIYAFGRADGQWSENRYPRWSVVKDRETGGYHRELFYHYFCNVDVRGNLAAIRNALRVGGVRRGDSRAF